MSSPGLEVGKRTFWLCGEFRIQDVAVFFLTPHALFDHQTKKPVRHARDMPMSTGPVSHPLRARFKRVYRVWKVRCKS